MRQIFQNKYRAGLLIVLLFVAGVILHLMTASSSDAAFSPTTQMSRIDFKEEIDSTTSAKIKNSLYAIEGVQHVYFNIPDAIVVFSHDVSKITSEAIYEIIQSRHQVKSERFVVTAEMAGSSCPVTGKNSIFVRAGNYLKGLFP